MNRWRSLAIIGAATFAAAAIGSIASVRAEAFYAEMFRPSWAPPGWLFGPVWTALYIMMAVAAWLVVQERGWKGSRPAMNLFFLQLVFNALWSWIFFAWRSGGGAFAEILLLWVLILATLIAFWRIRPLAGALMLPYLLWVSFATALTLRVWQLNPEL
jgi:benzodiazapine receptor